MKTTLIASFGFLALSLALAPAARACGRPDHRSALSAMMPALGVLTRQSVPEQANRAASRAERESDSQSITGLWLTTGTIEGQQTQSFEAFTSDGLEILNDNGSPLEGNVCLGVWQTAPKGVIAVNHPSWLYDPSGNLIGTAVIREQITMDAGGKTFHGSITVDIYDLNGNLETHLAGTYIGKRITA